MNESDRRSLGSVLRDARVAAGLTQTTIAERLRVKQPSVSAWETGEAFPSPAALVDLADMPELDLDLADLVRLIAEEQDGRPAAAV